MADFLIVRGTDHVVLGVRWTGLTVVAGPDGPALRADAADARLVLTFPPQHVGEEISTPGIPAPEYRPDGQVVGELPHTVPVWRARLSGPSTIAVHVVAETLIPLTVTGLLSAAAGRPLLTSPSAGPDDTVLELPWRLRSVPDVEVRAVHAGDPQTVQDVSGLWRTRLLAGDAGPRLLPIDPVFAQFEDPFHLPIGEAQRAMIVGNGAAPTSRLELSALGATTAINATWPNLDWEQRVVLGRDMKVRLVARGVLYPLGHRAEYVEYTERVVDPDLDGAAVLRQVRALTITEPLRQPPSDPTLRRWFPFDDVVITRRVFTGLTIPAWLPDEATPRYFRPVIGVDPVRFPIECHTALGPVLTQVPLLFVSGDVLADPGLAEELALVYGRQSAALPGVAVDLVRAAQPAEGDVHEVHALALTGTRDADTFRPVLAGVEVALPALRSLTGDTAQRTVAFTQQYLDTGTATDVVFKVEGPAIRLGFADRADKSGALVTPNFAADALSRLHGPVNLSALPAPATGLINPAALFGSDATVLGFPLSDLLTELRVPPQVTSLLAPGRPPTVRMLWQNVKLRSIGPFVANPRSQVDLSVELRPDGGVTTCVVRDFALVFPPGPTALLRLDFGSITYTQRTGEQPDLAVRGLDATFLGTLQLLEELQNAVDLGAAGQLLDVTPSGITVRYAVPVPAVSAGAFVLRNIVLRVAVEVPFDDRPVSVSVSFAERRTPFALSVLMFGGGGYIEIAFDRDGLKRLEAALEFGAIVAIDFLVASGEVHALGGVRFALEPDRSVTLTGYLRVGGCVEVLGLVSVSIEMRIELAYQSARKALVGRASIVVEIDLTLWSDSVEIDSGEWVLAGGSTQERPVGLVAGPRAEADADLERWQSYRAAFAHDSRGGNP
ncbi:hypothetical protein [Amycolatopsis vastitatis]|uniref:Uncharacterized protein n=1 Tax=Amycolatopsis vastitatis TaxID=1905142 RepID=A0A229TFR6_9PSEU|nr:hypothetical protein [Amycolatopsis vastitatis]OXM69589.1 hypothetical protein CF165_08755 [Amycolatopsis vastitatis]